jgi:hypothetical protein
MLIACINNEMNNTCSYINKKRLKLVKDETTLTKARATSTREFVNTKKNTFTNLQPHTQ